MQFKKLSSITTDLVLTFLLILIALNTGERNILPFGVSTQIAALIAARTAIKYVNKPWYIAKDDNKED
jgi:hypothetical protein